jgi:hypothetical protein
MKLFQLLYGKKKSKMKAIMVDEKHKCENYMRARESSCDGWHKIELAPKGNEIWKQKSSTIGGNSSKSGVRIGRDGKDKISGYIGKNGFNPHT